MEPTSACHGSSLSRRHGIGLLLLLVSSLLMFASPSAVAEASELAIKGYDPVAYFKLGRPTPGLASLEYEWDEHRYLFSSAEHRELFKADPIRYAPQFGNFCAMALTRGQADEANPEYWLISDDKLYLFAKSKGPERFRESLETNIIKANRNRSVVQSAD